MQTLGLESRDLFELDLAPKLIGRDRDYGVLKCLREYKFLKKFHPEIIQPVGKNLGINYVPSIFTEYARCMNNYHIDGIICRGSMTGKKDIVSL